MNNNFNQVREAKTSIDFIPIGSKSVVEVTFKKSKILLNDKQEQSMLHESCKIVAYGNMTHTIEIGDDVIVSNANVQEPIPFKWNSDKENAEIIKRYFSIEFVNILGIDKSNK